VAHAPKQARPRFKRLTPREKWRPAIQLGMVPASASGRRAGARAEGGCEVSREGGLGMKPKTVFAIVLVSGALGCGASVPPPNDQWAAAQADVGRAQAGGAPENPDAMLHLRLAQEDLQMAKQLMGQDDKRATTLTELARAEAQLALSLAKDGAAQEAAYAAARDLQNAQGR
jgi:hypothetical protein